MRSVDRWVWEKTSKALIIAITIYIIITTTQTCWAIESQNKTLTEVSAYNFTDGYYEQVKYKDNDDANYRLMFETDIPYLNLSYKAPADGYLDIYIHPIEGPFPYIELGEGWEIKSATYSINLFSDESVYFLLTPPLNLTDYTTSRVVGGGTTLWELYRWPKLSGLINYTYTTSDEISLDLVYHPSTPREGDRISLFTHSNEKINNISWTITGKGLNWENHSEVLEIYSPEQGEYLVSVIGYDEFNNSHTAETLIHVKPPVVESSFFDLSLFSIDYPKSVDLGEPIKFMATVDYFLTDPTEIKLIIQNPVSLDNYTETDYSLDGNGSIQFTSYVETKETGDMNFHIRLFYLIGGNWVEVIESSEAFSVSVAALDEPPIMPSFNLLQLSIGLILLVAIKIKRNNVK